MQPVETAPEVQEFRFSTDTTNTDWICGVVWGALALVHLLLGNILLAVLGGLLTILYAARCRRAKKTPFLRITRRDIMVFYPLVRPPKTLAWDAIREIRCVGWKVRLVSRDGNDMRFHLGSAGNSDPLAIMEALRATGKDLHFETTRAGRKPPKSHSVSVVGMVFVVVGAILVLGSLFLPLIWGS